MQKVTKYYFDGNVVREVEVNSEERYNISESLFPAPGTRIMKRLFDSETAAIVNELNTMAIDLDLAQQAVSVLNRNYKSILNALSDRLLTLEKEGIWNQ